MDSLKIFTVSEINASIRGILESQFPFISIAGEISNLRRPFSGHMYFTLKDEKAQIKAVLFKMQQRYLGEEPADGQHVVCRGRLSVYEPRGDYQIIVDTIDFRGKGLLHLEFERLKKKLAGEGLFDRAAKKPIPLFPEHVTLVTSPEGAAVHDFIRVARTRCPQAGITVYPVAVQGNHAAQEITRAIAAINDSIETSLIVLCRGGGSLEDLWAFNEEIVARAIADSSIPVVSAVGHEVDFTIADLAADLRAPTPSAAAEICLPENRALKAGVSEMAHRMEKTVLFLLDRYESMISLHMHKLATRRQPVDNMLLQLDHLWARFARAMLTTLSRRQDSLNQTVQRFQRNDPASRLQLSRKELDNLHQRLLRAQKTTLDFCEDSLARSAALLDAVSPLSILARGYSIVREISQQGKVVTDFRSVKINDTIEVRLHRGFLQCTIEKTGENRFQKVSEDSDKNCSVKE